MLLFSHYFKRILILNYVIIFLLTILPAAYIFNSNIEKSIFFSLMLLFGGIFVAFLNWKKEDMRVRKFINKFF